MSEKQWWHCSWGSGSYEARAIRFLKGDPQEKHYCVINDSGLRYAICTIESDYEPTEDEFWQYWEDVPSIKVRRPEQPEWWAWESPDCWDPRSDGEFACDTAWGDPSLLEWAVIYCKESERDEKLAELQADVRALAEKYGAPQ